MCEYQLIILNGERGISTTASIIKKERKGLIREKKYTVLDRGMTAVDHAAIIVQAMEILERRIRHISVD